MTIKYQVMIFHSTHKTIVVHYTHIGTLKVLCNPKGICILYRIY